MLIFRGGGYLFCEFAHRVFLGCQSPTSIFVHVLIGSGIATKTESFAWWGENTLGYIHRIMYGIFTYIQVIFVVNEGKYTIHGASGYLIFILILLHICCLIFRVNSMFTCKFQDDLSKPIPVRSMETGIHWPTFSWCLWFLIYPLRN